MSFSIRQLRYFVAVAEAGQISSAARGLYVSQSSVTMAVQEMERLLSQRLFTRGSRGVELTPTGSEFLPKARQILRLVDEAALVTATDTDPHGRLRVGVTYTVMAYFLPHQIQRLTIAFPNIDFSWLEMGRRRGRKAGLRRPGLRTGADVEPAEPRTRTSDVRAFPAPTVVGAGPSVVAAGRDRPRRCGRASLCTADGRRGRRDDAPLLGRPDAPDPDGDLFDRAVRSIVANGNGVAILSDMVYRPWSLEGKRVDTVIVRDPVPDMRIGLAWHRGVSFTPAMDALHRYFDRQFGEPAVAPA